MAEGKQVMYLSIVCSTHPNWGKVGIGWGFDYVIRKSINYAQPLGIRFKSKKKLQPCMDLGYDVGI